MHVVIVDGDISYPPTSGKRLRTLNLMLPLARRHRITYIARGNAHSEDARCAATYLSDHGITPILVDHPVARKSGPFFYGRLAANLLSPLPYSVTSHTSSRVREAVRQHIRKHKVDLWQFETLPYLSALDGLGPARTVLSTQNVETLIWQRYHEVEAHLAKRWYIRDQWRKWEKYERAVFARATRVVAASPEDALLMREKFGVAEVDVVDNGIDTSSYVDVIPKREPGHLLFLGSLEYRPNLDAVRLLLDQVFPAVLVQMPAAKLTIVGRNPPRWLVERVQHQKQVELLANVPDIRPYLARAMVLAVPLRIGGGSRLKILEALACGLPVVTTRVGAEGLCLTQGNELQVVESVEHMSAVLIDTLRDPRPALEMAERGKRIVHERYDWGPLADKMEQIWESCIKEGVPHRSLQGIA